MWLLCLLLFPAVMFFFSFLTAYTTRHVERSDSGNFIWYEKKILKDVPKGKVFENKEKKERNEDFSVKNPMPHEDADGKILSMTDSTMIPIYKRTEFYVLSGGVALYWVILIFIGLIIAICRNKFRRAKDEHKGHQKNEKKDERTEDV
ncbi:hypothetical protein X798_02671 [Onchocerca flexuosa]|uniref:Uncharacterized protein n=1 Tax=Onchocerca flexuosa TaxID=387005 RepID=A0A238BZ42_9BILA|nr:hypothetical protein X798_02671 [Onchocerca flexuosa]